MTTISKPVSASQRRREKNRQLFFLVAVILLVASLFASNVFTRSEYVAEQPVDIIHVDNMQLDEKPVAASSESKPMMAASSESKPMMAASSETKPMASPPDGSKAKVPTDTTPSKGKIRRIFHHAQAHAKGKSGRMIHDQLLCHAYAWHNNGVYGGACGSAEYEEHELLLDSIGLKSELPFACPGDYKPDKKYKSRVIQREKFIQEDTRIFIPEYVEFLKSRVQYPPKEPDKFTIAVHVKRGEVHPCSSAQEGFSRYLPNSHYQRLIDKYMKPDARVVIFAQSPSRTSESLDEFETRGYELHIDHPTTEVWRTIVVSDVVILSRGDFGFIPSMVSKGIVVYTPFWHKPLKDWHVVRDEEILSALDKDVAALKANCR